MCRNSRYRAIPTVTNNAPIAISATRLTWNVAGWAPMCCLAEVAAPGRRMPARAASWATPPRTTPSRYRAPAIRSGPLIAVTSLRGLIAMDVTMRGQLDGHIRPRAWVGLATGTALASYFQLIRHGAVLPRLWHGGNALQALWAEPRPSHPPVRVWRDWVLVAVVVLWSAVGAMLPRGGGWGPGGP